MSEFEILFSKRFPDHWKIILEYRNNKIGIIEAGNAITFMLRMKDFHVKGRGDEMMPFIQNVAWSDIANGDHFDPGINSMLISITDPAHSPPKPKHIFREIHHFEFLDVETGDENYEEFGITQTQAKSLVDLLVKALANNTNVIVHCHAGVCRSGAVCEVGVIMGFRDPEVYRSPNLRVKHLMLEEWMSQQGLISYAESEKQDDLKT